MRFMSTLIEQFEEIATRRINKHWLKAAGIPRAASDLCAKAFVEGWDRESLDGRVVIVVYKMVSNCTLREDTPALE